MKSILTPKGVTLFAIIILAIGLYFKQSIGATMQIGSLLLALWLAITLHELGHVIFGKMSGYQFVFFTTGPLLIEKTKKGFCLKENKHWFHFGGVAMMTSPNESNIKKMMMYAAGGPILSLIFAMTSFLLYGQYTNSFYLYLGIMNSAIFFATITPLKTNMQSDGYVVLSLLKNNEETTKLINEINISKELLSKKQPKDWDSKQIQLARQMQPSIDHVQYAMLLYYFEIEQAGFSSAVNALKGYSAIPITKKNKQQLGFIIHMKQIEHFLSEDVQLEMIAEYQQFLSRIEPLSFHRGEAMIAYLQDNKTKALELLHKVKTNVEHNESLYGFFKAEKTLTELIKEKIAL
ncbi:M50 family metallopeptidase [Heyndrickxia oleronia]|uniref:M50 family metallopeptidase n=1 Tax=Heyndrickxia oleronia TaxID=38875 RepID=A0AAW6T0M6_9BACI|nr:M50 family metallopeptidase [Heyndrickxia oleronia]MDH5162436.1 M50 family metallopeptidase [Heyndrickxia oleronia]